MSFSNHIFICLSLAIICLLTGNLHLKNTNGTYPVITSEKTGTYGNIKNAASGSIQVTSFNATIQNNQVMISWKAINEINNNLFLVEKSSNGSTFREISKIASAGSNSAMKEYSVKDTDSPGKITYYRLTHIDSEGNAEHCDLLALSNEENPNSDCKIKINPDPCLGKCSITFCDSKANSVSSFSMFDFLGNTLNTTITNKQESSGLEFDANNYLKPGIFISKTNVPAKNAEKKNSAIQ